MGLVSLGTCGETPAIPDLFADAFGRDGGAVTVPIEIHWGEGSFVVDQGDGEGRHLGRRRVASTRCALQVFQVTEPPFVNFDLRATLTAADGSELFVRNEFARTPFTPPEVEAPLAAIVGGRTESPPRRSCSTGRASGPFSRHSFTMIVASYMIPGWISQ